MRVRPLARICVAAAAWERAAAEGGLTARALKGLYVYPALDSDQQLATLEDR